MLCGTSLFDLTSKLRVMDVFNGLRKADEHSDCADATL